MKLTRDWGAVVFALDHAFQPIARLADGSAYGFEALLRGWDEAGFSSIAEVFDAAYEDKVLYDFDLALRIKAFRSFSRAGLGNAKLFYNVDTRLLQMQDYRTGNTLRIAAEAGLPPSRIVIELSELFEPGQSTAFDRVVATYRNQGFRIALDDFGAGYAGLQLLHRTAPDIVKMDRYFIAGSGEDPRKAVFLSKIAGLARFMGISVVAEGVETPSELQVCVEAGCDYVQGFLVARPNRDLDALKTSYESALGSQSRQRSERRTIGGADCLPAGRMTRREPITNNAPLSVVLARFREERETSFIPVVNGEGEPIGAYRERDFREYVYSLYGIAVLEHLEAERGTSSLLTPTPIAEIGSGLARVVEAFGIRPDSGGVILTEGGRYAGVLDAGDILALVAERELVDARDQNPLSRLPGNRRIAEICAQRLADPGEGAAFAYFDFDNFKPFNDRYGFRNGDRVIMLFADILKAVAAAPGDFIGHLGGDDFFACIESKSLASALAPLSEAAARFAREATSFYVPEDRDRGWILGKDRGGVEQRFELLGVSLAVVFLAPGGRLDAEGLSDLLARLKREAKAAPDRTAAQSIGPEDGETAPRDAPATVTLKTPQRGKGSNGQRVEIVFTPSLLAAF